MKPTDRHLAMGLVMALCVCRKIWPCWFCGPDCLAQRMAEIDRQRRPARRGVVINTSPTMNNDSISLCVCLCPHAAASKSREDEEARVDKELANIRAKFTGARLSEYDRRKYVWKMMYTSILGYEVDFGLNEVLNLIQFPGFKDKCVGYTAATVLMTSASEMMPAVLRAMRADIASSDPMLQCLALTTAANFGGAMIADDLGETVRSVFFAGEMNSSVRKKAALVLLRLFRVKPALLPVPEYATRLADMMEVRGQGAKQAVLVLVLGVLSKYGPDHFGAVQAKAASMLAALSHGCHPGYIYHQVNAPWFQMRLLRIMRYFPFPKDAGVAYEVKTALTRVLDTVVVKRSINFNNAQHAILFEAINVIIRHGISAPEDLRTKALQRLSKYVNIREPNVRYLGLESMTRMAGLPGTREHVLKQQKAILISLKESDISLRRRALDLLFVTCGEDNAVTIVGELVTHLVTADTAIRSEMVLKIAILAERFASDLRWYIDTILKLIAHSGDHVSDDIWHRAVQIITNNAPLQRYAAMRMFRAVEASTAHETAVKVAAYVLGEFGFLLQEEDADATEAGDEETVSGSKQFVALHQHFDRVAPETRVLLLSAYAKFQHLYEEELDHVLTPIFEAHTTVLDQELQQRAVEYLQLKEQADELKSSVLEAMPAFESRESALESRLKESGKTAKDVDEWGKGASGAGADEATPKADAQEQDAAAPASDGEDSSPDAFDVASAGAGSDGVHRGAPAEVAAAEPEEEDILGLGADAFGAEVAGASAGEPVIVAKRGIDPSMTASVKAALFAMVNRTRTRGRLFSDDVVQLGAVIEFRGGLGRLQLHVANKSSLPLRRIAVSCPGDEAVATKVAAVPDAIAPGVQHVVDIRFKCLRPFSSLLPLAVSFLSGPVAESVEHSYNLRAPVFASSFLEAVALPMDAMKARWQAMAEEPKAAKAQIAGTADAAGVLRALGAEVVSTSPDGGALGAATFRTETANAQGKKLSVGCLFKLGPKDGGFAVEVRTTNPIVTTGLLNTVKAAVANGVTA